MESDFKKRVFDKIFFSFPLCLLAISENKKEVLQSILTYCLDEYKRRNKFSGFLSNNFKNDFTQRQLEQIINNVQQISSEIGLRFDYDFNFIKTLKKVIEFINDFERKFGKNPYCKIGKDLFQDTLYGNLDFISFSVYTSISSILGTKKTAVRITKKRIKIRMRGFKDEKSFLVSGCNSKLISDKHLNRITDLMEFKKLLSKFTYQRRQTFYSIEIKSKRALAKWIEKRKLHHESNKSGLIDRKLSAEIKSKVEKRKQTISEMQEELQFENTGNVIRLVKEKMQFTL